MEELILGRASELFFNYGPKSISMDDLAKEAGVSKKTIYQFVSDKNELVIKVAQQLVQLHQEEVDRCYAAAKNAVEEEVLQSVCSFGRFAAINHAFFYDMERFFPQAWQHVVQYRSRHLLPAIMRNLQRGMAEGVYRADLDLEITAQIRLQQVQSALQPGVFPAFQNNLQQLMKRLTRFYLNSITSSRGSRLIDKHLNENHS